MTIVDGRTRRIGAFLGNGQRSAFDFAIEEISSETKEEYRITVDIGGRVFIGSSEVGYFDALREIRIELEKEGILLECFGASEDVFPSPTQRDMGPALKAYRTRMGHQALSKDIVDIFDTDASVRPATVDQQQQFHERWLRSLGSVNQHDQAT